MWGPGLSCKRRRRTESVSLDHSLGKCVWEMKGLKSGAVRGVPHWGLFGLPGRRIYKQSCQSLGLFSEKMDSCLYFMWCGGVALVSQLHLRGVGEC